MCRVKSAHAHMLAWFYFRQETLQHVLMLVGMAQKKDYRLVMQERGRIVGKDLASGRVDLVAPKGTGTVY